MPGSIYKPQKSYGLYLALMSLIFQFGVQAG